MLLLLLLFFPDYFCTQSLLCDLGSDPATLWYQHLLTVLGEPTLAGSLVASFRGR